MCAFIILFYVHFILFYIAFIFIFIVRRVFSYYIYCQKNTQLVDSMPNSILSEFPEQVYWINYCILQINFQE